MNEEWRLIPGCPGYEASSLGRIRSMDRIATYERTDQYSGKALRVRRHHRSVVLRPHTKPSGHLQVVLGRGGNADVHCLVLLAFKGPRPRCMEARHLDGNPANNVPSNLEWGTRSENNFDAVRHGTRGGERNRNAKLTAEQVRAIRRKLATAKPYDHTVAELAERYGVNMGVIKGIREGKTWKGVV